MDNLQARCNTRKNLEVILERILPNASKFSRVYSSQARVSSVGCSLQISTSVIYMHILLLKKEEEHAIDR
jgi:hypothetical protein